MPNGIVEWDWEIDFGIDRRTKGKNTSKINIDLALRRTNYEKSKFVFLELKTADDSITCIRGMVNDFAKVKRTTKKSSRGTEIREVFLVGIHSQDMFKSDVIEKIQKQLPEKTGFLIEPDEIRVMKIPNTDYFCTI